MTSIDKRHTSDESHIMQPPQNQNPNPGNRSGRKQLRLELPKDAATYANTVIISNTRGEVVFDFVQIMPNDPRARIQDRIIMTPMHAKMFLQAFQKHIANYEAQHGEIETPQRPESLADQLFKGISSQDPDANDTDTNDGGDDDDDTP